MYDVGRSQFIRHGPCEACGSRDNVAWYSNGTGFCFGCGRFYRNTLGETNKVVQSLHRSGDVPVSSVRSPPDDIDTLYGPKAIEWIKKYGLTVEDLVRNNVEWSKSREQLVYLFYGKDEDVILWQARNFRDGTDHKSRFFTGGTPEEVIATYPPGQTDGQIGVFVEDCISALKVGKSGFVGIPCFSSSVSARKLARIAKRFDFLVWWLDSDKFKEATRQRERTSLLGTPSYVIYTELDPKDYSEQAIGRYIRRAVYGDDNK